MKLLICVFLLVTSAYAQTDRDVLELTEEIRQSVISNNYDQRTLLRAKNQLENVLLTLGGTGTPTPSTPNLKCLARDNDNAAPYIFAMELSDFSIKRFAEYKFSSLVSCQSKAAAGRPLIGGYFTCVSRDGDDASPFVIASFFGDKTSKRTESFSSLTQCQGVVKAARENFDAFLMCVARDNDGSAPFIKVIVKRDGTSSRQTDTFSSIESCQAN